MTLEGYCTHCHDARELSAGTLCPVCGSPLIDLHEHVAQRELVPALGSTAPSARPAGVAPFAPPTSAPPVVAAPRGRRGSVAWLFALVGSALVVAGFAMAVLLGDDDEPEGQGPAAAPAGSAPVSTAASTPGATAPPPSDVAGGSAGTPAEAAGVDGIVVVSSTSYTDDSSMTIDGEGRYLYLLAELRNDGTDVARVGEITISIRDAAGVVIGTRQTYPIDQLLDPGEVTFVDESTPSMMYFEGETNTFPEGWATWDMTFEVERPYEVTVYDDVSLVVEDVVVVPSDEGFTATGVVVNTSSGSVLSGAEVYVALLDGEGRLVNLASGWVSTTDNRDMAAGSTLPFEVSVYVGASEHVSTVVGSVATPVSS